MDKTETMKILSVLRVAYPMFYNGIGAEDAAAATELWERILGDYDYSVVSAAVTAIISTSTSTYPPVPGVVVDMIHTLTEDRKMEGSEAWGLVKKALRNGLYGFHEEFQNLPPAIQKAVGSENQLREWAMMDTEELNTVVASNFQKSFRITSAREAEIRKLPSSVKTFVNRILESNHGRMLLGQTDDLEG